MFVLHALRTSKHCVADTCLHLCENLVDAYQVLFLPRFTNPFITLNCCILCIKPLVGQVEGKSLSSVSDNGKTQQILIDMINYCGFSVCMTRASDNLFAAELPFHSMAESVDDKITRLDAEVQRIVALPDGHPDRAMLPQLLSRLVELERQKRIQLEQGTMTPHAIFQHVDSARNCCNSGTILCTLAHLWTSSQPVWNPPEFRSITLHCVRPSSAWMHRNLLNFGLHALQFLDLSSLHLIIILSKHFALYCVKLTRIMIRFPAMCLAHLHMDASDFAVKNGPACTGRFDLSILQLHHHTLHALRIVLCDNHQDSNALHCSGI